MTASLFVYIVTKMCHDVKCLECLEGMGTGGSLLILIVSSCVYVQMVSTLWAGMMCIL